MTYYQDFVKKNYDLFYREKNEQKRKRERKIQF